MSLPARALLYFGIVPSTLGFSFSAFRNARDTFRPYLPSVSLSRVPAPRSQYASVLFRKTNFSASWNREAESCKVENMFASCFSYQRERDNGPPSRLIRG